MKKHLWFLLLLTTLLLALFATSTFTNIPVTHAASSISSIHYPQPAVSDPNLVMLSKMEEAKTCQTIYILSLHGKINSTKCIKLLPHGVSPHILVRGLDCSGNYYGLGLTFEIFNYNWTANLCFYATGGTSYIGVNIFDVNEIINENSSPGWFRWYPAAAFRVLGGNWDYYNWGGGNTNVEITQLCTGSSLGGHC